jgi:hypothetical protein
MEQHGNEYHIPDFLDTDPVPAHAALTTSVHGFDTSGDAPPQSHGNTKHTSTFVTQGEIDSSISSHAGASDPHAGYQKESEKGAVSGYASLDTSTLVVQNPANATATPTASKIPIADGSGKLDGWIQSYLLSTAFVGLAKITVSATPPAVPTAGDLWVETA